MAAPTGSSRRSPPPAAGSAEEGARHVAPAEQLAEPLVGVVGAGQMGNGIAHVFALAGYQVVLNDISADSLTQAIDQDVRRWTEILQRAGLSSGQ